MKCVEASTKQCKTGQTLNGCGEKIEILLS